jgi:hypothetical protein
LHAWEKEHDHLHCLSRRIPGFDAHGSISPITLPLSVPATAWIAGLKARLGRLQHLYNQINPKRPLFCWRMRPLCPNDPVCEHVDVWYPRLLSAPSERHSLLVYSYIITSPCSGKWPDRMFRIHGIMAFCLCSSAPIAPNSGTHSQSGCGAFRGSSV